MDRYIIQQAYPWQTENVYELEIKSDNLIYSELYDTHSGCQTMHNQKKIHNKCNQIANLIREIDELNKNK
jgi:hypothetical protein